MFNGQSLSRIGSVGINRKRKQSHKQAAFTNYQTVIKEENKLPPFIKQYQLKRVAQ